MSSPFLAIDQQATYVMTITIPAVRAGSRFAAMDRCLHGAQAKFTGGISPLAIGNALFDWSSHLANALFRRAEIALNAMVQVDR
ncbi:poly-beta-hydroxybutyrate polymerase N-terminal domain-containing protein [Sphingobium sp. Z007]|uniref:poly-beta-hydroxybutyrate polymerase N-terminal domain-containing protein n=2 Tax=Sphingobium sp. Z007 TaxID=627495 RepID=UPI00159592EF|nr:poly-beta-hydroxybutyrate polymerase N-terminal domain-containing protein [Sphingobium sp. Z007]